MEQSNPFDDTHGRFAVLINAQQQYSLWPQHCALPAGWQVVCEPQSQEACYRWLEQHRANLHPGNFVKNQQQKGIGGE